MDNRDFDKFIKNQMEHFEPSEPSSDWAAMSEMLDADEANQNRLLWMKGMEFLIVILVAITFWSFQTEGDPKPSNPPTPYQSINHAQAIHPSATSATEETADARIATTQNRSKPLLAEQDKTQATTTIHTATPKNNNKITTTPAQEQQVDEIGDKEERFTLSSSTNVTTNNIQSPTENKNKVTATVDENRTEVSSSDPITTANRSMMLIHALQQKRTVLDENLDYPELPQVKQAGLSLRMSYQLALDWNQASSSYEPKLGSSLEHENIGFSAGWRIAFGKNRWEVETGLTYNLKSYKPRSVFEVRGNSSDGFFAETIQRLNFNIVSVPLDIRFYMGSPLDKWNFYLMPGASANWVAFSNYDRYTYGLESMGNTPPSIEARTFKSKNTQRAGILHGESLRQNFYMMASLGVGAETMLAPNTCLFVQPKFSYYIMPNTMGIGPNDDQFNTFSLELGIRKKIMSQTAKKKNQL